MKRVVIAVLCVLLLSGCGDFHTAQPELHRVELVQVWATVSSAYYLASDGTLYSPGADSDAASYVLYQDREKGIVAEGVCFFEEMAGGGYYINEQKELCLWNEENLPLYGYEKKAGHAVVCTDVAFAKWGGDCMLVLKENGELYLAGEIGGEEYTMEQPKLLGSDVTAADTDGVLAIWANAEGEIFSYGDPTHLAWFDHQILQQLRGKNVQELHLECHYLAALADKNLWYCGEDGKLQLLGEAAETVSCAYRTLAALESDGAIRVWGKCIGNDATQTETAEYETLDGENVAENAVSIMVSDGMLSYVGDDGSSYIFHAGGCTDFYGNATNDKYVGIGRAPNVWIE